MNDIAIFHDSQLDEANQSLVQLYHSIENGELSDQEACVHGIFWISLAGAAIDSLDLSRISEMSEKQVSDFFESLSSSMELAKRTETLFSRYPIVAMAAKSLWTAIFYAKSGIYPLLASSSTGCKKAKEKTLTYLVRNPASGLIKIGRTKSIKDRMRSLQCGSGAPLDELATINADIEKYLHDKFSDFRVYGEWFFDKNGAISEFAANALESDIIQSALNDQLR